MLTLKMVCALTLPMTPIKEKQNKKRADVLDQETKKHGGIPEQGKENNAVDDIDVLLSEA